MGTTTKVLIVLGIIGLIFFSGASSAHNASINLSAGPEAEGQRLIDQATAAQMNAQTADAQALAAQQLEEAKAQAEALREAKIARANAWQKALKIGGSFFILFVLIVGGINLMATFRVWNRRVLLKPIVTTNGKGTDLWIPFPQLPFFAIQTWQSAPATLAWITPMSVPQLVESEHVEMLALAQLLTADADSEQKVGNLNIIVKSLGYLLEGHPLPLNDSRNPN